MINNKFLFRYDWISFSISQQKNGRYLFEVSSIVGLSSIANYLNLKGSNTCICDVIALYNAIDIIKAHNLRDASLLPPDISYDDLNPPEWGQYLELEYFVGDEHFSLFGDEGICATPRVIPYEHPLYYDVIQASFELLFLFLSCKDNEKTRHGAGFKGLLKR